MVDQTRFTTEQMAFEILRELLRPLGLRGEEGNFFVVDLKVPIRRADSVEDGALSIYVERFDFKTRRHVVSYRHKNKDAVIETVARLSMSEEGKPFDIDVSFPYRASKRLGATITVSEEMERLILEKFHEDIERELS